MRTLRYAATLVIGLASAACGGGPTEADAKLAAAWANIAHQEASLWVLLYEGGRETYDPDPAQASMSSASAASSSVLAALGPCADADVQGATVLYTFNACQAPFGLSELSGEVRAIYDTGESNSPAHVSLSADADVHAGGYTLDPEMGGENRIDRSYWSTVQSSNFFPREIKGMTSTVGTSPDGSQWDAPGEQGTFTGAFFEAKVGRCLYLSMSNEKRTVDDADWDFTGSTWQCEARCPSAGKLYVTVDDEAINMDFDGTPTASVAMGGEASTLDLGCTPCAGDECLGLSCPAGYNAIPGGCGQ